MSAVDERRPSRTSALSIQIFPSLVTETRIGSPPLFRAESSLGLREDHRLPALEHRGDDHEDDEEHQHDVDERRHVDVALHPLAADIHRHRIDLRSKREGRPAYFSSVAPFLHEEVDQLGGGVGDVDLHVLDAVGEVVEHHHGGDGHQQAEGGGDERLGDAGGDRAQAAGAGGGHGLEGGDDAGHRAEEADEGGGGADRGERAQAAAQVVDGAERAAVDGAVHGGDDVEGADVAGALGVGGPRRRWLYSSIARPSTLGRWPRFSFLESSMASANLAAGSRSRSAVAKAREACCARQ